MCARTLQVEEREREKRFKKKKPDIIVIQKYVRTRSRLPGDRWPEGKGAIGRKHLTVENLKDCMLIIMLRTDISAYRRTQRST